MHTGRVSQDMEMMGARTIPVRLSLGPLLYYWPRDNVFAFYEEVESWPVDCVYLGETVCSKRFELRMDDWLHIARRLADQGKEVVLSTCELIESESDLRTLRKITGNGDFRVEANDLGAVHLLAGKTPFIAGPYLNIYSRMSLEFYREIGASRWVMPIELSQMGLREVLNESALNMETEVFSYGRLPLAVSARCFTARYNNLSKDDCGFRCIEHPDGLTVSTQDDEAFLVMNGLQTQSARVYNLVEEVASMIAMGVTHIRISPQSTQTGEVAAQFHAVAQGALCDTQVATKVAPWAPEITCNGYWYGQPGLERVNTTGNIQKPNTRKLAI
ncbi:MAG: U32 family peptidase [Pseudomonadota bacterium]